MGLFSLPFVDDSLRNTDGSLKDEEAKKISIFVQLAPIPHPPSSSIKFCVTAQK